MIKKGAPANQLVMFHIYIYEYRTKLGMTKVVLRGSWGCHHCKTDRDPPKTHICMNGFETKKLPLSQKSWFWGMKAY